MSDVLDIDATTTAEPFVCHCGTTERHATNPHMCARGHFIAGNSARRIHGADGFRVNGTLPDALRLTVDEFRAAVITDRGGPSELTTVEAAYIRRLSEVEAVARLLAADLAARGLTTPRGRVRSTMSRWLETLDRWDKFAQRVGVTRRARAVETLRDYLRTARPETTEGT
jgi:hypothetical protein